MDAYTPALSGTINPKPYDPSGVVLSTACGAAQEEIENMFKYQGQLFSELEDDNALDQEVQVRRIQGSRLRWSPNSLFLGAWFRVQRNAPCSRRCKCNSG